VVDCTGIALSNGKPLPKAGVLAEQEGEVAADRIADELACREPTARFAAEGNCYVETGAGLAGTVHGRFYAQPPQVEFRMPTVEAADAKAAFGSDRLAHWFGP
jgi:sulfide:quinone oxidoreductase